MNKVLLLIILFLPTTMFAGDWFIEEGPKYDSSQTVILESTKDYVILENKSALIEAQEHSDFSFNFSKKLDPEAVNKMVFIREFGDDAAKECERQGKNTWFRSTDKRPDVIHEPYLKIISEHKGKFLCLPHKTMYTKILDNYLFHQSNICPAINNSDHELFCAYYKVWIRDYTFKLKELGVDIVAENEKSLIAQKQKKCVILGFKMGTEKNGDCVLRLMELEKQ